MGSIQAWRSQWGKSSSTSVLAKSRGLRLQVQNNGWMGGQVKVMPNKVENDLVCIEANPTSEHIPES